MGLDTGATMGEVLVAETLDASATIPTAVEPNQHTAAIVTGYSGPPEVMSAIFQCILLYCLFSGLFWTTCTCWLRYTPDTSLSALRRGTVPPTARTVEVG